MGEMNMTEENNKQQDQVKKEKKYYWLKLKEGFFRDKRIKKLRRIAGGDTYTIIYLKMQLLSLREKGLLLYEGVEDTLAEELATELDEETENVTVTLNYLFRYGLLEEIDGERFLLPEAVKNIGSEGTSAERMRKHRAKKKIEKLPGPSNSNALEAPEEDEVSQSDVEVTKSDDHIETREKKEEKREKREELTNKQQEQEEKENIQELTDKQRERVEHLKDLLVGWSVSDNQIFYLSSLLYKKMDFDITDSELTRELALYEEFDKLIKKARAENVKHIYRWLEVVIPNWRI